MEIYFKFYINFKNESAKTAEVQTKSSLPLICLITSRVDQITVIKPPTEWQTRYEIQRWKGHSADWGNWHQIGGGERVERLVHSDGKTLIFWQIRSPSIKFDKNLCHFNSRAVLIPPRLHHFVVWKQNEINRDYNKTTKALSSQLHLVADHPRLIIMTRPYHLKCLN